MAIGLALHIQSLPAGSRIGIKDLAARFPESEHRIARALRELEVYGYLARTRVRLPGGQVVTRTVSCNRPGCLEADENPTPAPAPPPAPAPVADPPLPTAPAPQAAASEPLPRPVNPDNPAGLLARRLTVQLPPPLAETPRAPAFVPPDPFQTCTEETCGLAFRAPEPGLCGECRAEAAIA
ncbi:helix-turn-helix domain-containing protein [Streptomyces sp. NPDC053429]|uniref:helix-turn-helix domain-containing protein n=1 Tax=Streptomyces sp. NPDC053429 TaxID=3365702 RepID=UPI0037CE08B8